MSSCCCPEKSSETLAAARCPESGSLGKAVDRRTVKALLTEAALQRLPAGEYRFCPDAACDVVYFSLGGPHFTTADVRVAVWQKLPFGARQLCYCFGESEALIRADIEATGASSAVARIREHVAADRCACDVRNPRGACCLGDVIAAVDRATRAVASGAIAERRQLPEHVDG
jgi:hypothetical protein